jgi:hypothetical protein
MALTQHEIQTRFGFHKATIEGPNATKPAHAELRARFMEFAQYLDDVAPDGRYLSLALTELENASMWAHKAIAQQAPLEEE